MTYGDQAGSLHEGAKRLASRLGSQDLLTAPISPFGDGRRPVPRSRLHRLLTAGGLLSGSRLHRLLTAGDTPPSHPLPPFANGRRPVPRTRFDRLLTAAHAFQQVPGVSPYFTFPAGAPNIRIERHSRLRVTKRCERTPFGEMAKTDAGLMHGSALLCVEGVTQAGGLLGGPARGRMQAGAGAVESGE
jgi:hypothetical protein